MNKNHKHEPEPEEGAKAVRTHIALTKYRAMVKHLQGPMVLPPKPNSAGDKIAHAIIGIADEAGEFISILKRHLWYGEPYSEAHMLEELGDIFHYIMYLMIEYGWTIDDVMRANTEKLSKRYPEGFNTEDALKRRDKTQDNDSHAECMCPGCKAARGRESSQDKGAYGQIQALEQYRKEIKTVIEGTIAGFHMNSNAVQHLKEGIAMVEKQLSDDIEASQECGISRVEGRPHPIE